MPTYLSAEWLEAASSAVAENEELQSLAVAPPLVIQQTVTGGNPHDADAGGDQTTVSWHVELGPQGVRWAAGTHPEPDVTFRCDADTAWAVQTGTESAQAAFMAGRLRIGGDTGALIAHHGVLAELDDALADLRARTTR